MRARLGAIVDERGTSFTVWAPRPRALALELVDGGRVLPVTRDGEGYGSVRVEGVGEGARYFWVLDGERRPDPASRRQPEGVHGPSQVVDPSRFVFRHAAPRTPLADVVLYELHVGAFTREGTFAAAAAELGRLVDLGVTAVEVMPIAAFPGRRNWGYDGVDWLAVQESYGGPAGFAAFVDEAHRRGLLVVLDVVYNHFGPEGAYVGQFGDYFTSRHATPWGDGLDYAARPVRELVLESATGWVRDYRVDGLRLDAVHAIVDDSPEHVVRELVRTVKAEAGRAGREALVIAESDLGDVTVIEPAADGGWGCDAQWADDLHHALHVALTGERHGYYGDYARPDDPRALGSLARAVEHGFAASGQPAPSRGGRPFGTPSRHLPAERFVVCAQNHDQVGNRGFGERLAQLAPTRAWAAAAVVLLAPGVPLLFMGEEYAEPAPFLYFTDHGDPALRRAVTEGRRREFRFAGEVPDPEAPETFQRSILDLARGDHGRGAALRRWYQALLAIRRERPSLRALDRARVEAFAQPHAGALVLRRWSRGEETLLVVSLAPPSAPVEPVIVPAPRRGRWRGALDAGDPRYGGPAGVRARDRQRALEVELPEGAAVVYVSDET